MASQRSLHERGKWASVPEYAYILHVSFRSLEVSKVTVVVCECPPVPQAWIGDIMLARTQIMIVMKRWRRGGCLEGWRIGLFVISSGPKEAALRSKREQSESTKARESHRHRVTM